MTTKPAKVNEKRGQIVPSAKSHLRGLPPRSASNGFFIFQANALLFFMIDIPPFPMMFKTIPQIRRIQAGCEVPSIDGSLPQCRSPSCQGRTGWLFKCASGGPGMECVASIAKRNGGVTVDRYGIEPTAGCCRSRSDCSAAWHRPPPGGSTNRSLPAEC